MPEDGLAGIGGLPPGSNPFSRASDGFRFVYPNRGRKNVAGNIRQRQRFAGHAHAVVVVVAALSALILQHRNVNSDFYLRMIPPHPFDGRFKIGSWFKPIQQGE